MDFNFRILFSKKLHFSKIKIFFQKTLFSFPIFGRVLFPQLLRFFLGLIPHPSLSESYILNFILRCWFFPSSISLFRFKTNVFKSHPIFTDPMGVLFPHPVQLKPFTMRRSKKSNTNWIQHSTSVIQHAGAGQRQRRFLFTSLLKVPNLTS